MGRIGSKSLCAPVTGTGQDDGRGHYAKEIEDGEGGGRRPWECHPRDCPPEGAAAPEYREVSMVSDGHQKVPNSLPPS